MGRAQRSLVAVQSTRSVHVADSAGGIHCAGSRSAWDRLVFAVTATRDLSEPRSLAYDCRRSGVQSWAPAGGERHSKGAIFLI